MSAPDDEFECVSSSRTDDQCRTDRPASIASDGVGAPIDSIDDHHGVGTAAAVESAWASERSADEVDALAVGDFVRFTKTFVETDVTNFARSSGDTNPLHLEDAYAAETRFEGRILHGTLVAGTISAALARLPGVAIYRSQRLEFQAPVTPGETVTAECELIEVLGDDTFRFRTTVTADDETVVDGEAVVLLDRDPAA